MRARMELSPRSMASVWMVGLEDEPNRCGEICVFEVFGDALEAEDGNPIAAVGMGVHPFRDPALTEEFSAERMTLDVAEFHVYSAEWRPGSVAFLVDGEHVKTVHQAPEYPMQMMVGVFDFPEKAASAPQPDHVPELSGPSPNSVPVASEITTVNPAKSTERPAVSIAICTDSRTSWPAWSCSRNRVTISSA